MKFYSIIIAVLFLAALPSAARIQGYTYDFYTLDLLNNTFIEIDSNPPQQVIARNGFYSLTIPPGNYVLEGKYLLRGEITLYTIEYLNISSDGTFELDLLLEPAGNSTYDFFIPDVDEPNGNADYNFLLALIGIGLILFLIYYDRKRHIRFTEKSAVQRELEHEKKAEAAAGQKAPSDPLEPIKMAASELYLTDEAKEVLDAIRKSEGRIQQKELRKIFKFSEAKMSNLLDDLEEAGKIRRIKKGRGNIIRSV
ncbi:MAG: hypothetical protein ABIG96_01815 [Candidatus Micrarchaeota archaeon]